ncbi:MAG: hypothetical protein AAB214_01380, partial [Fibrobacterota bacterium]
MAWLVVLVWRLESAEKGPGRRAHESIEKLVHSRAMTDSVQTFPGAAKRGSGWLTYGGQIPDSRSGDHPSCGPIHAVGRTSNQVESGLQ